MTDQEIQFSKPELLKRINQTWNDFQNYLNSLTEEQLTKPADPAGWTPKDHVMHLAVWEDGIVALLNHQSRIERMGIDPETWEGHDYDRINDVIFQRHKGKSWAEVKQAFEDTHKRLLETLDRLSEEDLQKPHNAYAPDSDITDPVWHRIVGNTIEHYPEHGGWMDTIVKNSIPFSKPELFKRMAEGWDRFQNYLNSLSEEQLTKPADPAGWTAKDHVMHLAVWENGILGLLNKQSRREAMEIDPETWATHDDDRINDVIFRRTKGKSWAEVKQTFEAIHRKLLDVLQEYTDDELKRPASAYEPESKSTDPVWAWIVGHTFGHYDEHRPWIDHIVSG